MKRLVKVGSYSMYFAGNGFVYRGIWIWNGKRNIRIVPFNRFTEPFGGEEES